MNFITINDYTDFKTILESDILITGKISLQQEELEHNTWGIMFDSGFVTRVTLQDLQNFFAKLIHDKSLQLQENKYQGPVTLYIWFDELSLQLCFDILSGQDIKLPFGGKINILTSKDPILQNFLDVAKRAAMTGKSHIEIIKFLESGDKDFDQDDARIDWIQDVYVMTLP